MTAEVDSNGTPINACPLICMYHQDTCSQHVFWILDNNTCVSVDTRMHQIHATRTLDIKTRVCLLRIHASRSRRISTYACLSTRVHINGIHANGMYPDSRYPRTATHACPLTRVCIFTPDKGVSIRHTLFPSLSLSRKPRIRAKPARTPSHRHVSTDTCPGIRSIDRNAFR